jgi:hypothetical protein
MVALGVQRAVAQAVHQSVLLALRIPILLVVPTHVVLKVLALVAEQTLHQTTVLGRVVVTLTVGIPVEQTV